MGLAAAILPCGLSPFWNHFPKNILEKFLLYYYIYYVPSFGHVEVKGQLAGIGFIFLLPCRSAVVASALFC